MRLKTAVLTPLLAVAVVISAGVTASASPAAPYQAHPGGRSYETWLEMTGQFYLGDASNPLFAALEGDCGQVIGGVYFMAAPIDAGLELDCDIPVGTPIVLSHAGWFTTEGIDGDTDQELEDAASAGFVTSTNELSLDGKALPLAVIETGAFDVVSEPGSFYDAILGVGTGPIRTSLTGNIVVLHPLSPGDHVIEAAVDFVGDGSYSVTYHVHVG